MLVQQKSMVLIYRLLHQQLITQLMFKQLVDQINILFYGASTKNFRIIEGNTYIFTYPSAHPFALSTTSDGSHGKDLNIRLELQEIPSANTLTYVVPVELLLFTTIAHRIVAWEDKQILQLHLITIYKLQQPIKVTITSAMLNMLPLMMFYLVQVDFHFHFQMAA